MASICEEMHNWEGALMTYRRSLEVYYDQPDLWNVEENMEEKVK